jgi:hypothetical protein
MGGACRKYGKNEECTRNIGQKTDRKGLIGRSGSRLEDNIKIDLRGRGCNWIHLS